MARQNNFLRLSESVGEMVHYERSGKFFTRAKPTTVNGSENLQKAKAWNLVAPMTLLQYCLL